MKKALSILAVLAFGFGMISCEADNTVEETEALYLDVDTSATDGDVQESEGREG